jgi:hypothetical protein
MEIEGLAPALVGWTRMEDGTRGVPWKEEAEFSKRASLWGLEVRVEAMVAIVISLKH